MRYSDVFLIASLALIVPVYGIAIQSPSSTVLSRERCERPGTVGGGVVVGPYPLQVMVTNIDYENATIDFITEAGTSLHVTQAPAYELGRLQVGDTVELCIAETLHGDSQI